LKDRRSAPGHGDKTRAILIGPYLDGRRRRTDHGSLRRRVPRERSPEARIEEACGLAEAIDVEVVATEVVSLSQIRAATFLGQGKVEKIAALAGELSAGLVIMDCALSAVQQRNLEKAFAAKVIDRTGLILEIFGRRARTREGALQVELAHLTYQKSRLVRSWTHLERQRGGFGFLGGPGETQIETDRRLIEERITRIERDLARVKKTRGLHRKQRRAIRYPIVALVGYTNAGKSTLFNSLTKAEVVAADMLFATLDPTLRALRLPRGKEIIISDTVGFISDLPTMLVAAFKATLEEVVEAEIILHVRDIAHPDAEAQRADVEAVLADLGIDAERPDRVLEIWNKMDLLNAEKMLTLRNSARRQPAKSRPIIISALKGQGIEDLITRLETRLTAEHIIIDLALDAGDGRGRNWLYEHTEVLSRSETLAGTLNLTVRATPALVETVREKFSEAPPAAVKSQRRR
jgi:GTPase